MSNHIYFTIPQTARILGIHPNTLHRWIREGRVKTFTIGRRRYILLEEVQRILKTWGLNPLPEDVKEPPRPVEVNGIIDKALEDLYKCLGERGLIEEFREEVQGVQGSLMDRVMDITDILIKWASKC